MVVRRNYNHPTSRLSSKDYVRKGGAKSVRFTADYWAVIRKRKEEQRLRLLDRAVADHVRFLSRDGQSPHYVFFGGAHEARLWTDEFRRRLDTLGLNFDPKRHLSMARPSRLRGISRRMVAVWASDPMPTSDREYRSEVEALYCIEERNRILGYESGEVVSRETASV
ncbi:hypothetical protein SEA_WAWA_33 [Arthrobacter phage Wawa]|uniref:Uncharacterized protein n=2 Tax=Korravirus TaxID=1982076 RepID=A0A0U3TKL5_9CAUD|nr:hypothetical protein FDH60_gp32 [Arthrobacter phage Korra]YP_010050569.1 hypothetical protein KDJ08_gp33 [Arthrobacter phage Wawa]ALY09497.1 hypothetical protein PBI_KORRA_33 [Arthrobacter phage Korra]AZS11139.1 hypothetical protein SEA_WAWA_33 [Arthrobacter phage Wawa]